MTKFFIMMFPIIFGEVFADNRYQAIAKSNIQEGRLLPQPSAISSTFTTSQKLRIYLDYQDSFNILPDVQFYKDNVIAPAVAYLQNTISPKSPMTSPILIDRDCTTDFSYQDNDLNRRFCTVDCSSITTCSNTTVPNVYLKQCYKQVSKGNYQYTGTSGVGISGADLAIIVTTTKCGGLIEASAVSCFAEPTLDRPILGVMTLCQDNWNPRFNIQMNINTIKHEIVHALGFAADKFAFYRDVNGKPLTPRDSISQPSLGFNKNGGFFNYASSVAITVTRSRSSVLVPSYSKVVNALILPTVLAEARNYFGCPTLDGVDLTDATPGTVNSHFSKLMAGNELMTPNADAGEGLTSRLTLSLLQDTGWYNVDLTQAQNYTYGKGFGCNFVLNGCYDYIRNNPTNLSPFCNTLPVGYAMRCSSDRRYIYSCNILKNIGLDSKFVYFNQLSQLPAGDNANSYSGDDAYAEYCPTNAKITYPPYTTDCNIANNNLRTDLFYQRWNDYYGSDSTCFDTTATVWTVNTPTLTFQPTTYGAKCLQYKCDPSTLTLYVYTGGQTVCRTTTQSQINQINVNYLSAYINCPAYADVCTSTGSQSIATTMSPSAVTTIQVPVVVPTKTSVNINCLPLCLFVFLGCTFLLH